MGGIIILYIGVSLLYLYTGLRALMLDPRNKANKAFLVMTGSLFVRAISWLMVQLLVDPYNILMLQLLGQIAAYVFYSALLYFALMASLRFKKQELPVGTAASFMLIINICVYVFAAPEEKWDYGIFGQLIQVMDHKIWYPLFFGVQIFIALASLVLVFWQWSLQIRQKRMAIYSLALNIVLLSTALASGYLELYESFNHDLKIRGLPILVLSILIAIIYCVYIENNFLIRDVPQAILKVLELMQEGFLIVSEDYIINRSNELAEKVSGYSANHLYGKNARDLFENMDTENAVLVCADGSKKNITLSEAAIENSDHKIEFRIISFRDIEYIKKIENKLLNINEILEERVAGRKRLLYSIQERLENEIEEHKKSEAELERLAYYDLLTGLPNRLRFHQKLNEVLAGAQAKIGLLAINIDSFKRINDTLGHNEGDRILRRLADLIQVKLEAGEMVARMEGNEFLVLIRNIHGEEDLAKRARQLQASAKQAFCIKEPKLYLTMSIGGALSLDTMLANDLIYHANVALYNAKTIGPNRFEIYGPNRRNYLQEKIKMREEIAKAIDNNEFILYYQPQVAAKNGQICGTEGLIRWQHPVRGLVKPGNFIPQIENENLILRLGEWVLDHACRQIREWEQASRLQFLPLSVNLSMHHFESEDIINLLNRMIDQYKIDPSHLKIEITENSLSEESDALEAVLAKIRQAKISLTVDDFGTGYSSFHYLKDIKADILKIPREYVSGLGKNRKSEYIVKSMINLGHSLGMRVIAEGVEGEEEKRFLLNHACDMIQGYYYFRPMHKEDLEKII